jgi:hypothetical protein
MKIEMVDIEEGTDYDRQRGFYRFKRAIFKVNGTEHTLKISMPDFNAKKTQQLVEEEAKLIVSAMESIGKGTKKD